VLSASTTNRLRSDGHQKRSPPPGAGRRGDKLVAAALGCEPDRALAAQTIAKNRGRPQESVGDAKLNGCPPRYQGIRSFPLEVALGGRGDMCFNAGKKRRTSASRAVTLAISTGLFATQRPVHGDAAPVEGDRRRRTVRAAHRAERNYSTFGLPTGGLPPHSARVFADCGDRRGRERRS